MPNLAANVVGAGDDDHDDVVVRPFPKISISAINCNSLNMSTAAKTQHLRKIYGIVKLKTDIIFLSDIRLCNKAGLSNINQLATSLSINPYCAYKIIHNSRKNSRGVAILYKNDLPFSVIAEERDTEDNYLVVKASIHAQTVILLLFMVQTLRILIFLLI